MLKTSFPLHSLASLIGQAQVGRICELDGLKTAQKFVLNAAAFAEITALPALGSLQSLLSAWTKPVQAHLPDQRDENSHIEVKPQDAQKLFTNHMSLLFNRADYLSPLLLAFRESVARELGFPKMTDGRCMIYATPPGQGTAWHFDQNLNFVVQLKGTKIWKVSRSPSVVSPTQRHVLGQPMEAELSSYTLSKIEEPIEYESFTLRPGEMLLVPQGHLHATLAEGSALALNFTYSQPSFADLFLAALRSRLVLSPEWREFAQGAATQMEESREICEMKMDALLNELKEDLPHWEARDILSSTEGD